MSAAYVQGVQVRVAEAFNQSLEAEGVMACLKHWAFNEQETNRMNESSVVDERTAWELYYPPFEAGVNAGAGSVMCSYNRVNGTHACGNEELLRRDLKQRMGFRGFVMTDWWALHHPAEQSVVRGLDMEMPGAGGETYLYGSLLRKMEEQKSGDFKGYGVGEVYQDAAYRILSAAHKMQFFDSPSCTPGKDCIEAIFSNQRSQEGESLAMRSVAESIVLLKNEVVSRTSERALPLSVKRLALMGEAWIAPSLSTNQLGMFGDYYSGGGSGHCYIPPENFTVPFTSVSERAKALGIQVSSFLSNNVTEASQFLHADDADTVVILAATTAEESRDRPSLHLDNGADDLIQTAAKTGKSVIVLMQVPGTIILPWKDDVDAIVLMFLGGEFTGYGWTSVLFGDQSPCGKLPIMLPKSQEYTIEPGVEHDVVYSEGLFTSYRSKSADEATAYPFGHGLSYTEFRYSEPKQVQCDSKAALVCVQITVKNTGSRHGAEVVQSYFECHPQQPHLVCFPDTY